MLGGGTRRCGLSTTSSGLGGRTQAISVWLGRLTRAISAAGRSEAGGSTMVAATQAPRLTTGGGVRVLRPVADYVGVVDLEDANRKLE